MTIQDDAFARYDGIAIALHWLIALGILSLLAIGLAMTQFTLAPSRLFALYQLHKSIGITVLLAAALRVAWRLTHRPPPVPAGRPLVERKAASAAHVLLYLFMLGLPLTGWALVSASVFDIPTVLFGIVPWPHLPVLPNLADKAPVEALFKRIHAYGAWMLIALVALHVGAALRHRFVLHDAVLARMLPRRRRPRPARPLPPEDTTP